MFTMIPYRSNMMNRTVNPFADDFFRAFFAPSSESNMFRVDVKDNGSAYLLEAEMPGVAKENIHVDLENDVLTISAETSGCDERNDNGYVIRERRTGSMSRSFSVEGIRKEDIQAAYQDGVLRLTLPKENGQAKDARRSIEIA